MTKPDDVSASAWEAAKDVLDGYLYKDMSPDEAIARAIDAATKAAYEEAAKAAFYFKTDVPDYLSDSPFPLCAAAGWTAAHISTVSVITKL